MRGAAEPSPSGGARFVLRAAALYRTSYSSSAPRPGDQSEMNRGQLSDFRAAVQAALKRGAISFADARAELDVLKAAEEFLRGSGSRLVLVEIGEEPFRIREPRKASSNVRRKNRRKRRKR